MTDFFLEVMVETQTWGWDELNKL